MTLATALGQPRRWAARCCSRGLAPRRPRAQDARPRAWWRRHARATPRWCATSRPSPTRSAGAPTGSLANLRAVDWALGRFREAGVTVRREPFTMPGLWLERSARRPRCGATGFSSARESPPAVLDRHAAGGRDRCRWWTPGAAADSDFARLGAAARGAFVLIETGRAARHRRAVPRIQRGGGDRAARVRGRRQRPGLHVLPAQRSAGAAQRLDRPRAPKHPMLMMERDAAARALRLLRAGKRAHAHRRARPADRAGLPRAPT